MLFSLYRIGTNRELFPSTSHEPSLGNKVLFAPRSLRLIGIFLYYLKIVEDSTP